MTRAEHEDEDRKRRERRECEIGNVLHPQDQVASFLHKHNLKLTQEEHAKPHICIKETMICLIIITQKGFGLTCKYNISIVNFRLQHNKTERFHTFWTKLLDGHRIYFKDVFTGGATLQMTKK